MTFQTFTTPTLSISGGELTLSPSLNNPSPFLNDFGGLDAASFGAELTEEGETNAGSQTYGSGWDFLWKSSASITISAVPEPAIGALLLLGALLLGGNRFRKKLN